MKTISLFVSSILLLTLLAFSHALCQAEQVSEDKATSAQELPFRLNVAQEETADGPAVKPTFTNESDAAVTIDQDALRSASPSILVNEKAGEAEGTKLTRFASSKTYSSHPLTRDQILHNSSRAITVKPRVIRNHLADWGGDSVCPEAGSRPTCYRALLHSQTHFVRSILQADERRPLRSEACLE